MANTPTLAGRPPRPAPTRDCKRGRVGHGSIRRPANPRGPADVPDVPPKAVAAHVYTVPALDAFARAMTSQNGGGKQIEQLFPPSRH